MQLSCLIKASQIALLNIISQEIQDGRISKLTLFRISIFGTAHRWGEGRQKKPLKYLTYILQ